MKILFVLENYYPKIGGVETLFKNLVESLVQEDHQVTVLTNGGTDKSFKEETNPNLKIIRLPFFNRYLFTFLGIFPVFFYSFGKDLIHTTSYNAALPAFIGGKLTGKKVIITFHEVWASLWFELPFMSKFSKYLHFLFEQFILKFKFDHFVAVSNYTMESLIKNGIKRTQVSCIYNGIYYNRFDQHQLKFKNEDTSRKDEAFELLFFGRLGISKGLDVILDAIELLKDDSRFKFTIVIPSKPRSLFDEIHKLVKEKNIANKINFRHHLTENELFDAILNADAVLIPSYSEGFCFAAVETMALGTPIIHSNRGALSEVVNGKHIPLDSLDANQLKKAIIKAFNQEWDVLPVVKFELKEKINQYIKLYNKVLNKS